VLSAVVYSHNPTPPPPSHPPKPSAPEPPVPSDPGPAVTDALQSVSNSTMGAIEEAADKIEEKLLAAGLDGKVGGQGVGGVGCLRRGSPSGALRVWVVIPGGWL